MSRKYLWIFLSVLLILAVLRFYESYKYNKLQPVPYAELNWTQFKEVIIDSLETCSGFKDSALLISDFVHSTFRAGIGETYMEINDDLRAWNAEKWYRSFATDSFSGTCDHAARYLKALYKEFGLKSYMVFIAKKDWSDEKGHVTNLVSRPSSACPGLSDLYWIDSYFNVHAVDGEEWLSLEKHLQLLASGSPEQIRLLEKSKEAKYLQSKNRLLETEMYLSNSECNVYRSGNENANYVVECPRTLGHYLTGFGSDFADIASSYGYHLDFNKADDFKYAFVFTRDMGEEVDLGKDMCGLLILEQIWQRAAQVQISTN